jgi:hypothetical protein
LFPGNAGGALETLTKEVEQSVRGQGLMPGSKEYSEAMQIALQERVTAAALSNPQFRQALMKAGGPAQAVMSARRQAEAKTTITTGPKGRTVREQY